MFKRGGERKLLRRISTKNTQFNQMSGICKNNLKPKVTSKWMKIMQVAEDQETMYLVVYVCAESLQVPSRHST